MPRVSIVMPVYNGEKFISESIDSVLDQTFTDWELIIVNEFGSNKETTEIIHRYEKKDSRIKVIQNEQRLRIAESLNVGMRNAAGEYIARMDSDDRAGKMRIQKQVEYLDSHPEIGIIGIHPTVFGDANWDWNTEYDSDTILADSLFFLPFLHPTVMFRKNVIEKNGIEYNKEYFYTEDYDFFERILHVTKASNIDDKSLFFYRIHGEAATFAGGNTGIEIYKEVMARTFERLNLVFNKSELSLLCIHEGCKKCQGKELYNRIEKLDLLLKDIFIGNITKKMYQQESLFNTLHKRWIHLWNSDINPTYNGDVPQLIKEQFERSIFYQKEFSLTYKSSKNVEPKVTVLMPVYNGQNYLFESIKSIQNQTFTNWELLIINDASTDNTVNIVKDYQKKDDRIRLITNETNLKIAKTLNKGICEARGLYIARMDDDDISLPTRLEKEVEILDKNPSTVLVGSWQKHFGTNNWVHRPPELAKQIKATLLFECCVCHSTVMFKKDIFIKNKFFYDSNFLSEDYELWTRVSEKYDLYTIPEILGEYRLNGDNITSGKEVKFDVEARNIVAKTLRNNLHINVKDQDKVLLAKWTNPFQNQSNLKAQKILIERERELLDQIRDANKKCKYYDEKALDAILKIRWKWVNGDVEESRKVVDENLNVKKISVLKRFAKRIVRPLYRPFQQRFEKRLIDIQQSVWDLDGHLDDYYERNKRQLTDYFEKDKKQLIDDMKKEIFQYTKELQNYQLNELEKAKNETKEKIDSKVWQAEKNILDHQLENNQGMNRISEELHRHIDVTYRDMMIAMNTIKPFIQNPQYIVHTNYPIAYESNDYKVPHGTVRDNTRYPRFILWCEKVVGKQQGIKYMDLGCSGGGLVLDAALRGHIAIGLEGCDESLKQQRAEWRLLRNNLFTCDITKKFEVTDEQNNKILFDVISAWEVLEHIAVDDLTMLCKNIKSHLIQGGYFVASIANYDDIDPETGINWHVNQHNYEWWKEYFEKFGFTVCTELITPFDLARGTINPSNCYEQPYKEFNLDKTFYIVLKNEN